MPKLLKCALLFSSFFILTSCSSIPTNNNEGENNETNENEGTDNDDKNPNENEDNPDEPSIEEPQEEGLYTKMTRAISNLANFEVNGTLEYAAYDLSSGTTLENTTYITEIALSESSYYYAERDLSSNETIFEEKFSKNEDGKFVQEVLDYSTNEVNKIVYTDAYDTVMKNPLLDLVVQDFEPIKGQLNYYEIIDMSLANKATNYLTGYDTISEDALSVSQFSLHFDGDNFDQMRILLEYYDDYSEPTYCEQYLFTLQLSSFGKATVKDVVPFEETENHPKLQNALNNLASAKNMTIEVDSIDMGTEEAIATNKIEVDFENYIFLNRETFNKGKYENGEKVDEAVVYEVIKQTGDLSDNDSSNDGELMIYYLRADTNKLFDSDNFNEYYGTSSTYNFYSIVPFFNLLDAACYKDLGNNEFAPYITTYDYALASFVPYGTSYASSSTKNNMKLFLKDDALEKVELSYTTTDPETYSTISLVDRLTYNDINSTNFEDYILNLGE